MEYRFNYTNSIVKLLQEISLRQGEISNSSISTQHQEELFQIATVDSVHYSSKIEGNPLTIEQVTIALNAQKKPKTQTRNLKEVLNYSKARNYVQSNEFQLNLENLLITHKILMNGIVTKSMQGKLRTVQNAIRDSESNKIVYMPPEHFDVKNLMSSLLQWLRASLKNNEISPLILSALYHFQFESIHPFIDGNGRMGRLWSHGILCKSGFDFVKFGAIEKFHEQNRKKYYELLHKFQGILYYNIPKNLDLTQWIEYWLLGLSATSKEASERVNGKRVPSSLISVFEKQIDEEKLVRAINIFKRFKKLKASEFQDLMGESRTQAVADLNKLIESKAIIRVGGGRSTVYKII
jgi:Fic family protein